MHEALGAGDSLEGQCCAYCQTSFQEGEGSAQCPTCRAFYHADCWEENGGCAVYGCPQVPRIDKRKEIEIPVSYWGQDRKACPRCRRTILATALRCRFCGAIFETARPESRGEFRRREEREQVAPSLRRGAVWLFVLCMVPVTAPFAAVAGFFWYASHRKDLRSLPALYMALTRLAVGIGFGQTVLIVLMASFFALVRGN